VSSAPDYLLANRTLWNSNADDYSAAGRSAWASEPRWGIWQIPETEVGLLPSDVGGAVSVELGCGTGYVSAWLQRRGARPIGVDNSQAQLATAMTLQGEFDEHFPLVHAAAEACPLRDGIADLVISEYGAAIWSDPYRWIPEAARLLRPGGELVFLGNSSLLMLAVPDEDHVAAESQLIRPQFGMHRFEWPDDAGVEFHLSHGDRIRLLRETGFEVLDLIELRPSADAETRYEFVDLDWARKWPTEEAWRARKH
jgi:SAM-dependent methyltransferase